MLACPSIAGIITVDDDGSADFNNIQAAIDYANNGDEIICEVGTYTGDGNRDIDFKGKSITVRSTEPNNSNVVAQTIIDCQGTEADPHRGFVFHSGEDGNSIISGLNIVNGYAPPFEIEIEGIPITVVEGGGVLCYQSSPTIDKCSFIYNRAPYGGAVACEVYANPYIVGCKTSHNSAAEDGGGIYCHYSSPTIVDCVISQNQACFEGGGIHNSASYELNGPILERCQIVNNIAKVRRGGGICCRNGNISIIDCLIANNFAGDTGGGTHIDCDSCSINGCTIAANSASYSGGGCYLSFVEASISNSIFKDNSAPSGASIGIYSWSGIHDGPPNPEPYPTSIFNISYSNVEGGQQSIDVIGDPNCLAFNWGPGNIDADPCFVEPAYPEPIQGIVSWWNFNEGQGITAHDTVGSNDGTLIQNPTWTTGQIDGALNFDGEDDYVIVPDSEDWDFGSDDFAISFWVNFDSLTYQTGYIGLLDQFYTNRAWSVALGQGGGLQFAYSTTGTDVAPVTTFWLPSIGQWHHIVVVRTSDTLKIFADGEQKGSDHDMMGATINNSWVDLYVGAGHASDTVAQMHFDGSMDDIRIYNRALSADEIQQLYWNGLNRYDYHLQSESGRWDLSQNQWVIDGNTSGCIDAGNPGCPLGGELRNGKNVRINMGAYGGTATASKTPPNWRSIADLTNDWVVDFNDVAVFVDYWLDSGECIPSDLDRNQNVDFRDYAVLACPSIAEIITVDDDGLADFNSIQPAIDSADDGDVIMVQPGLYQEVINFLGKNITLMSTNPVDSDVVAMTSIGYYDGDEVTVTFRGTEDANCTLAGFDINGAIKGFDSFIDPTGENHTHATISFCSLQGNKGHTSILACDGTISNCLIADNINQGEIIPIVYPAISNCHGLIKNCTIVNNYCTSAIKIQEGRAITIENCIIYGNQDYQIFADCPATVNILYSNIEDGLDGIWPFGIDCTLNLGPGNIDIDPCFVRDGYWDFNEPITFFEGDYHLQSEAGRWDPNTNQWVMDANTSACIDAGTPGCPLCSEPSDANNIRINMGAYGGTGKASRTPYGWALLADLTNDGIVDVSDLAAFVDYWLESGECVPSDLGRDLAVDFVDFNLLGEDWFLETIWY